MRFFLSKSCVLLLLSSGVLVHCAVHFVQDCFLAVTYLVLINLPISAYSISKKFVELPLIIVKGVLIEVSIAQSVIYGTSGVKSKYYPGSCSSLLISLCRNVSFCFCLWFSKYVFLKQRWSFESVPKISLPPCIILDYMHVFCPLLVKIDL